MYWTLHHHHQDGHLIQTNLIILSHTELNLEQHRDTDLSDGPNQRREPWIPALQMAEADVPAFLKVCWFSSFLYCVGHLASLLKIVLLKLICVVFC